MSLDFHFMQNDDDDEFSRFSNTNKLFHDMCLYNVINNVIIKDEKLMSYTRSIKIFIIVFLCFVDSLLDLQDCFYMAYAHRTTAATVIYNISVRR